MDEKEMKTNYVQLFISAVAIVFVFLAVLFFFTACASPQKIHDKALKHGYIEKPITEFVKVTDTIKGKNGKDSIIIREIPCICPDPAIQTRWRTRFDNKRFKDSLKHYRAIYIDSIRNARKTHLIDKKHDSKQVKQKQKTSFGGVMRWGMSILAFLFVVILALKFGKK